LYNFAACDILLFMSAEQGTLEDASRNQEVVNKPVKEILIFSGMHDILTAVGRTGSIREARNMVAGRGGWGLLGGSVAALTTCLLDYPRVVEMSVSGTALGVGAGVWGAVKDLRRKGQKIREESSLNFSPPDAL
jgi:hypothetical protein